jgi:tetratricopeptide (TPR) repeat protein
MTGLRDLDSEYLPTTDGEIAAINLESARQRAWSRFLLDPLRVGIAESLLEHERTTVQFMGSLASLDRLALLAGQLAETDQSSATTLMIQAQVASVLHQFSDAKHYLAQAELGGAPEVEIDRIKLIIDQACGRNLENILDQRRRTADGSDRLDDYVALGSLLADLHAFTEADRVYRQALKVYRDVSPFPIAWVYFQLGVLWGELVHEPQLDLAANWYRKAIDCLPGYTKARVHLAEIYSSTGRTGDAEALLIPALSSGDPEVHWRLADVMTSQRKCADAEANLEAARWGFENLLGRYPLAFADHGAEFYAGSGNDPYRALELARINVANRPTLQALEQAHTIAISAGDMHSASELIAEAKRRWGNTDAFLSSKLTECALDQPATDLVDNTSA